MRLQLRNIGKDKLTAIKSDLNKVIISDRGLAVKYQLTIKVIQEIKLLNNDQNKSRIIRITGLEKKSAYYENETYLLSCPFYNPKELIGAELEIFKYLKK